MLRDAGAWGMRGLAVVRAALADAAQNAKDAATAAERATRKRSEEWLEGAMRGGASAAQKAVAGKPRGGGYSSDPCRVVGRLKGQWQQRRCRRHGC